MGKFKDETNGKAIERFCGLRSKLYTFNVRDEKNVTKKAKGISKAAKEQQLSFSLYEEALIRNVQTVVSIDLIRSRSHQLYVETVHKKFPILV